MPSVERTITVDRPLDVVWDYVSDFTSTRDWDPPTQECTVVTSAGEDGRGVGTVYRNVSKIAGSETEIIYTVTEYVARQRLQVRGETSSMDLLDTVTFEGGPDSTTLTYHAEMTPRGAAKLVEPMMPLGLKRLGDKTADSLEETLNGLPARR
jgi:hypothetical protein